MHQDRPRVLLIGDWQHREFEQPMQWLHQHTDLDTARTIEEALDSPEPDGAPWGTIILALARLGQFRSSDVARIIRSRPLTQIVTLLGSWCEGEPRSGQPWPGVIRVYWHQWLARCPVELRQTDQPTAWQLPRTSSPVERTLQELSRPLQNRKRLVAVATSRRAYFDALSRACQLAGYSAAQLPPDRPNAVLGADVAIWDGAINNGTDFSQLRQIANGLGNVPVVALLDFPRIEDLRTARQCGACSILARPFTLPDLWSVLESAIADASPC